MECRDRPSSGGSSAVEQRTVKCASAAILWSGVQISLSGFFIFLSGNPGQRIGWRIGWYTGGPPETVRSSYGHITVKAPHPIRTAKLSTVELDQYLGRGLPGNLQCCMAFLFFFVSTKILQKLKRLRNGESNPGHLRDRQRCYQLHHIGSQVEYLGFDPSTSCLLSTHASDCANTPCVRHLGDSNPRGQSPLT